MRLALVAALLLVPTPALAAQFVVAEVTYEHSATTTTDSHLRLPPSAETPKNWKAPVDYATAGTVHVRLEVFTKPSAEKTRFQICFEGTPSYACTDQSPIYTTTGVYTWATPFPSFYQYAQVDWTKGILKSALILKDDKNVKPAPENVGDARSKLFMPSKVRVTVTVVSPGSTYVPPSTDAGVDATIDAADAAIDAASDAAGSDTGAPDIGAPDTGAKDADAIPDGGPAAVVDEDTGCSTSSGRRHAAPVVLFLLAGSLFVRRPRTKRRGDS
ncbi:MAG: hypothetical protein JNL79_16850 [Myxococcales bacterium]|nr:hypothetical protein [Myxococcales bacterium]